MLSEEESLVKWRAPARWFRPERWKTHPELNACLSCMFLHLLLGLAGGADYIAGMRQSPSSPFDNERVAARRRRFRAIPVRTLVPNIITLLALCFGLTAIRFAAEGIREWAVYAIVFAAALDGIDGRVARLLKGTSRFGAELDSLADFVNFGVAPALTLYFWSLHEIKSAGWIAAMVFAIAAGLRLARFNVMIEDPNRPPWAARFFTGIPAPAGAITVLLPVYIEYLGVPRFSLIAPITLVYTLAIAFLMVSRLPVYSGKRLGTRVPSEMLLPVFIGVVLFFALLISYPWEVLTIGTVLYLFALPFGWLSYRDHVRRDAQANEGTSGEASAERTGGDAAAIPSGVVAFESRNERSPRR
jgi:CDP-diacylglycerol--serine O-phosphatidyltransferase